MSSNLGRLETCWCWRCAERGWGGCVCRAPTSRAAEAAVSGRSAGLLTNCRALARQSAPGEAGSSRHEREWDCPSCPMCWYTSDAATSVTRVGLPTSRSRAILCRYRTSVLATGTRMLKAKKIRLNVSEQDAATLEMMQGKCRGLYNWWVMKLRAGERWNWKARQEDASRESEVRPSHRSGLWQAPGGSLLPAGQGHASLLQAGSCWREARVPPRASAPSVLHALLPGAVRAGGGQNRPAPNRGWTRQEGQALSHHPGRTHRRGAFRATRKWRSAGMPGATITPPLSMRWPSKPRTRAGSSPSIWASKRWPSATTGEAGSITSAASRAPAGTTSNLTRSAPSGTAAKRSRAATSISHTSISGFLSGSATNAKTVCTKQVISSVTNWLKALW